jgi:hypothetical protein
VALSALKTIFSAIAVATLSYFAPGIGTALASKLGITSGFLTSLIGSTVLAVGLYGVQSLLMGSGNRGSDMEAGKVNVRLPEPPRWLAAGQVRMGGGVLFAEFDASGNFWYLIVHADSILTDTIQYYLDDIPVTLDGSGFVQNKEFRLKSNKDKDPAEVDGEGDDYIQIWTTTHTETNPTPPAVAALASAFPGVWTSDHKLVGTTYSVIKMTALPIEHRYKIYKWRGAIGVGEPAVSIAGEWSNVYDPRDETQTLGDRSTYKPTNNAALIWAWFRTHKYGRRKSESSINWDRIAEQADICDEVVSGLDGNTVRYRCGIGIPENKQRVIAEQEILMSMDGQIVFDDDGKTWCRAGHWYTPTLALYRNRDVIAIESVEARNGESETQGVIVRYTDPDARYTVQPSAAWLNPIYYVPGENPQYLTVDILSIHDHNQAMRVAKAIGMRSQPLHKIAPTLGLRGLRARQERIANLNYDNTFAGDYEIVTPVEVNSTGVICGMGMVPVDEDRWNLLPGEESPKPVIDGSSSAASYPAITGESLAYTDGLIVLTLPALPRPDALYRAQYIITSEITGADADPWLEMTLNGTVATSGPVMEGTGYTVRYRYVTGSGNGPAWEVDTITPAVTVGSPTNFTATDGTGEVILDWRYPSDPRFSFVTIFRHIADVYGSASDISGPLTGPLSGWDSYTDTVAAGTYYYWIVADDGTGNKSNVVGSVVGISS